MSQLCMNHLKAFLGLVERAITYGDSLERVEKPAGASAMYRGAIKIHNLIVKTMEVLGRWGTPGKIIHRAISVTTLPLAFDVFYILLKPKERDPLAQGDRRVTPLPPDMFTL